MEIVGVIPAAGKGARLNLPFSKELFPLPVGNHNKKIVPVIGYLLSRIREAGVKKVFTIVSKEKKDLIRYLGSGKDFDLQFCYLIQEQARGMPEAISLTKNWINQDTIVLFGMPDTIFFPQDSMCIILDKLLSSQADLVLGLFPTQKPNYFGLVDFDKNNRAIDFLDKPFSSHLKFLWGIGCWKFSFMEFLSYYVQKNNNSETELLLSNVFKEALNQQLDIIVHPFEQGEYYDIGIVPEIPIVVKRLEEEIESGVSIT